MRARALSREDVQQTNLRALLLLTFAGGAMAWWRFGGGPVMETVPFFTAVTVTLGAMGVLALSSYRFRAARVAFLVLLTGAATVAVVDSRSTEAGYLYLAPLLAAAALFPPVLAPACAALGAAVTLLAAGREAALPALLLGFVGLALWLVLRTVYELLDQYSHRAFEATHLAEQLRDQRGKLNRTIKDLDFSYQWLQQSNRELALARQEAEVLRDLRNRFATNLSHELRTPLNIILGFSQLIYLSPEVYGYDSWNDLLLHDLGEIQRNAGYLSQLVSDIVDLARVDALAMPIRREPTQLDRVAREAVQTVASLARDKGLDIQVALPEDLPPVHIDPMRVRQVLFNLVTNAIRYTDSGSVRVSAERAESEVVVAVADTGSGIAKEDLETIFDEFYQVGKPKEGADSGKGLGLAIARRFVQLHGGRIWVESELGRGSTFRFSLPLSGKSFSLLRSGVAAPAPKARLRPTVLVAGGDGSATGYLRRRLEGCDFVDVETPEEVEQFLAEERPLGVIVSEPATGPARIDAETLLALLPEEVPVIRCSLPTARWLSREEQFSAILTKPVMREDVIGALAVASAAARPRVLVIDDDRGFVQLLSRMIRAADGGGSGYEVQTAYSGEEALRKMARSTPEVVLVDLVMPGMTGFDVLARMRRDPALRDVPVVAVTAATPGEDHMVAHGAVFSLMKRGAFQPGELLSLILTGLGQATAAPPPHSG